MHFSSGINHPPYEAADGIPAKLFWTWWKMVLSVSSLTRLLMKALPPMATMKKPAIMYRPAMEGFLQVDRSNLTGSKKVAYNRH